MPNKLNNNVFIERCKNIHDNKYDYTLVNYINSQTKVKIICLKHGIFEQKPNNHLQGQGCRKCYNEGQSERQQKYNNEIFIKESNIIHNYKYDYSLLEYKKYKSKVKIICPEHKVFYQVAYDHLRGIGCPKCAGNITHNNEIFIKKSKNIHGNKYDYSLIKYKNNKTKVKIICPIHGVFEQRPDDHLRGIGCPSCNDSKGEKTIKEILESNSIIYHRQKTFNDCKYKRKLKFDFYLPEYNILIEYDGIQHFNPIKIWGGEKQFIKIKERDNIKNNYCKDNNIRLIRIKYNENIEEKILKNL